MEEGREPVSNLHHATLTRGVETSVGWMYGFQPRYAIMCMVKDLPEIQWRNRG
jgi:hypothetical protein